MKSPQEIEAAGRYHAYSRGWAHACAVRPQDTSFTESPVAYMREEYASGYLAGVTARRSMYAALTVRTGHMPTVLRAQAPSGVPAAAGSSATP